MLGCNETLGVDDGNSVGIRLGTSLGKFETGASTVGDGTGAGVGSRSTHSFPSQQNPLPQSHTSTKSLSSIEQSQLRLLQVFGNGSVPSQQGFSVTIPPFSTQKLMTGDSVGLGVVGISVPDGTGAGVGSSTGNGVGMPMQRVPSQQNPSSQSQKGTGSLESGGQPQAPMLHVLG